MEIQNISSFILSTTTDSVAQQSNAGDMSDIIGIGGILATIIVGIITCIVTWKLTLRSIKQQKLTYNKKILNILSNSIKSQQGALNDLTITYGANKLNNPYLLLLEIENTGNEAIVNPPICIKAKNSTQIIPGYFQDIPPGYEEKWKMKQSTNDSCNIILEHINPKQIVKVCFFLDNSPEIVFECPMQNIIVQEKGDNFTSNQLNENEKFKRPQKVTFALLILTVILFISMDFWMQLLYNLEWDGLLLAPPLGIALFILSTLVISILLNVFGVNKLDELILKSSIKRRLVKWSLLVLSALLTFLILFDILIVDFFLQIVTAIIIVFMLSLFIHIMSIDYTI